MFSTNPTNDKREFESGRLDSERIETERSSAPKKIPAKPKPVFENVEQFSAWIDAELEKLERRFVKFQTQASVRGHFGR